MILKDVNIYKNNYTGVFASALVPFFQKKNVLFSDFFPWNSFFSKLNKDSKKPFPEYKWVLLSNSSRFEFSFYTGNYNVRMFRCKSPNCSAELVEGFFPTPWCSNPRPVILFNKVNEFVVLGHESIACNFERLSFKEKFVFNLMEKPFKKRVFRCLSSNLFGNKILINKIHVKDYYFEMKELGIKEVNRIVKYGPALEKKKTITDLLWDDKLFEPNKEDKESFIYKCSNCCALFKVRKNDKKIRFIPMERIYFTCVCPLEGKTNTNYFCVPIEYDMDEMFLYKVDVGIFNCYENERCLKINLANCVFKKICVVMSEKRKVLLFRCEFCRTCILEDCKDQYLIKFVEFTVNKRNKRAFQQVEKPKRTYLLQNSNEQISSFQEKQKYQDNFAVITPKDRGIFDFEVLEECEPKNCKELKSEVSETLSKKKLFIDDTHQDFLLRESDGGESENTDVNDFSDLLSTLNSDLSSREQNQGIIFDDFYPNFEREIGYRDKNLMKSDDQRDFIEHELDTDDENEKIIKKKKKRKPKKKKKVENFWTEQLGGCDYTWNKKGK